MRTVSTQYGKSIKIIDTIVDYAEITTNLDGAPKNASKAMADGDDDSGISQHSHAVAFPLTPA